MAEFPGLPENPYEYVNRFDYSVWTAGTTIQCCVVPWDASYRDVVRFASEEDKAAWFQRAALEGATGFTLSGLVYLKAGEPVRLPVPFSQVNQCNYLVVRNPEQPVPSRVSGRPERIPDTFYYFVTDVRYLAPNCTELSVQLDVWMTYGERLAYGLSFVARGHAALANENCTLETLADYLTDAEGLEYGDEYEVVSQEMLALNGDAPWVLIMSTADLTKDWGTVSAPNLTTATGASAQGMYSGCAVYAVAPWNFKPLMDALSSAPWVSQCITYMTLVPTMVMDTATPVDIHGVVAWLLADQNKGPQSYVLAGFWRHFELPERYAGLLKLYTSPYCMVEVTALSGAEIVMRPECLRLDNAGALRLNMWYSCTPPDVRIVVTPAYYNAPSNHARITGMGYDGTGQERTWALETGENLDMALTIANFPQLSLVNNGYMAYMASTAYTRAYSFESASWAYEKAGAAAGLSRQQARRSMGNQADNQAVANRLAWQSNDIAQQQNLWGGVQQVAGGAVGALGNLASGNMAGAAGSAVGALTAGASTALNAQWMSQSTANQVGAANATLQNNLDYQAYAADSNYQFAKMAAAGDYKNAIAGIQAQVDQARLTQPSTVGQNGADVFNWANGLFGILVKFKRPKMNHLVQLGEYFLRYGYIVNRWIRPPRDLCLMDKFTYWEIQDPQVFGEVPEVFKQTVRGILSAGVTVWTSPDLIGRTDFADNAPKGGFSY